MTTYSPHPIDTSDVVLPPDIADLTEKLAENTHDVWAAQRIAQGWTHGDKRDDVVRKHPCLVPYADLPKSEKQYDRETSMQTLKVILSLGYRIVKAPPALAGRLKG
jgi:ryanodine receptor 2